MAYTSSLSFDSVVVIESLHDEITATGTILFNETITPVCLKQNVYAELITAPDRRVFFGALERVRRMTIDGRAPIVQLEAHGTKRGLELASKEIVAWEELAGPLTAINQACRMNLLVVAAACRGWHLSKVLSPIRRSPVWGVLGPPDDTYSHILVPAMQAFYETLITKLDVREALGAMNAAASPSAFRLTSCELLLCQVFRAYVESLSQEESQEARVSRLVADLARADGLDVLQTSALRVTIRQELDDHEQWFERYKTRFLMLDLFPENRGRHRLKVSDCGGAAA